MSLAFLPPAMTIALTLPYRQLIAAIAHRTLLAVAAIVVLTPAAADAARYKKGSFTKTTATASCPNGPPACTNVVAHGLGETPKALILWTNTKTSEAYAAGFLYGFGVSDGPLSSRSVSLASLDAVGTSDASRRMASKALTIVYGGELLVSEADLVSWDETNFTLSWTTNITNVASVIHYIVIGGGDVSAKVVDWQMPAPGVDAGCIPPACAKVVDTVGFQPDVVFHAHAGANFTAAFGTSSAHGGLGFGVMTASGEQWSNALWIDDAANTSDSVRGQQTDACLYGVFVDTNASGAAAVT